MKRRKQLSGGPEDDRGAALLLVLVVVTVIGLAGAALLTFSATSIRTTVALRDQAGNSYSADGAAQVAINSLSMGYGFTSPALFNNKTGTTCFGPNATSGTLNLPGFYPGSSGGAPTSASVTCLADPGTGVNAMVSPINSTNRPAQAILTLGQTGEDGINVRSPSTNPLAVKGPVRSNSDINVVSPGTLRSTAAVTAFGPCTGSIVSTPSKTCNTDTDLVDPKYASEASAVPAYRPVPADVSASCPNNVFTFEPGYYDDARELTDLMTGNGPCGGSTWWFKPGTYYFDFHNNTNDSDVYRASGHTSSSSSSANRWEITRGHLVAGTPVDSNGNPIASPGGSPTIPGSCQNPIKSATAAGVQFIFGGDSQLALGGSANAEICGTYHADRPPIAVYGVQLGTATTTTLSGPGSGAGAALKMSTYSEPSSRFTSLGNIVQEDGAYAIWNKTSNNTQSSTINVAGYSSLIPPGSIVKDAKVRIKHRNSEGYKTADGLTIAFTPKGVAGSPPASVITLSPSTPNSTNLVTDLLDIYSGGTSAFVKYVHDNGFTGATMDYTTTLRRTAIESLDAIQIDISYVVPAFRAENILINGSNCMRTSSPGYTGASGSRCAVLSTSELSAAFTGRFYIQGTTYTPIAAIDLTLNNPTQPVLSFGVISRSLWVKENSPFSYPDPVIQIPDDTIGDDGAPIIFLTVHVCPARTTSSCSSDAGAITALRVKARINDAPPRMTILSWSNLR
jgi:hypothetical protein